MTDTAPASNLSANPPTGSTTNTSAADGDHCGAPSARTRIRRISENADYQRTSLYEVIDAAYLCHVAFADATGTHCIPTACWREGDHLYIHGSNAARLTRVLMSGVQACVTITHLDGLVLARAAFNHSMNYRSAMIYGVFERVGDEAAKHRSLAAFMEKVAPGRQAQVRPGSKAEMAGTSVMRLALDEAACKIRRGGPHDDPEDMDWPVWAGVVPLRLVADAPVADAAVANAAMADAANLAGTAAAPA